MNAPMTAPTGGGFQTREKRSDVTLVPFGFQPCILYGIIDQGTQESEWPIGSGKKTTSHKIRFLFEFPLHKQIFFVDDTEFKPSVLSLEMAFMISNYKKKTKLLEFIEAVQGPLAKEQYSTFDISSLLNKYYTASVQHYQKSNGTMGAKIAGIGPFQAEHYQNHFANGSMNITNSLVLYSLSHGFESPSFASMSFYDRKIVKGSAEGIAHSQRGGKFVKFDENNTLVFDDAPAPVAATQQQPQGQTAAQMYQQNVQNPTGQMPAQQGYDPQGQPQGFGQPAAYNPQAPAQAYAPTGQPQQPVYGQPQQGIPQGYAQSQVGMQQPAQPSQPVAQPQSMATPASPAQQFMTGQVQQPAVGEAPSFYPATGNGPMGQPVAGAPTVGQAPNPNVGVPQGMAQPGQPAGQMPAQQTTMNYQAPAAFKEEDHDDLPF